LAVIQFSPECKLSSSLRPEDLSGILADLLRAAECLRNRPADTELEAAFEQESFRYRKHLQELKHFLPGIQLRLLAEKVRLENARIHLAAANAWAQVRRKIL
jgi:hypothetical protein